MSTEQKIKPIREGSRFKNPWVAWPFGYIEGVTRMTKWLYSIAISDTSRPNLEKNLPIKVPYFKSDKSLEDKDMIKATWLGHASVLVYIDGFHILCDPVFSQRCPPPVGPKRFRDTPCEVKDLPDIDAIVISHNHYDHMDSGTISELSIKFPDVQWLIPMDVKNYLVKMAPNVGRNNVTEMMWWDKKELSNKDGKKLTIHFTPTQHWSNRGMFDSFKSLWGSFAMVGSTHRFWFGGDTGYCTVFKSIGAEFGPFDAAAIPIGAYEPRDLTVFQHCNPEEAVKIHRDIKSKVSFGIHWGTFRLTSEFYMDPKERLEKEVSRINSSESEIIDFRTINHGETLQVINNSITILSEKVTKTDKCDIPKDFQIDEAKDVLIDFGDNISNKKDNRTSSD